MNYERLLILGNRLKLIRAEAKLKQKDFAAQFGVSATAYAGYETGKHEPTIDFLIKVADKYELSLDYVVGRSAGKEGLIEDEFTNAITDEIINPFMQEGKRKSEIMEEVYNNMSEEMIGLKKQMEDFKQMIDDERKKEMEENKKSKK
ncbi:MAG: helix-turn-helix transcriptional regulator [Ruminococcus sp.]|nr:helix-turn-helix transcriptional regulator [Ruminococcus sp.]